MERAKKLRGDGLDTREVRTALRADGYSSQRVSQLLAATRHSQNRPVESVQPISETPVSSVGATLVPSHRRGKPTESRPVAVPARSGFRRLRRISQPAVEAEPIAVAAADRRGEVSGPKRRRRIGKQCAAQVGPAGLVPETPRHVGRAVVLKRPAANPQKHPVERVGSGKHYQKICHGRVEGDTHID